VSRALREIAAPFVAAVPAGARVRTRLRVCRRDAEVLTAVGRHLGALAGRDLAARCAEGRLGAPGRAASRRERKRALTAQSSSRWAGAITRTSEDAYQLASRNLAAERGTLTARARKIEARPRKPPATPAAPRKPAAPRDTRQPHGGKTSVPHKITAGNQAPEDRSRAPTKPVPSIARCLGMVSGDLRLRMAGVRRQCERVRYCRDNCRSPHTRSHVGRVTVSGLAVLMAVLGGAVAGCAPTAGTGSDFAFIEDSAISCASAESCLAVDTLDATGIATPIATHGMVRNGGRLPSACPRERTAA
jgi:hypothetical protein